MFSVGLSNHVTSIKLSSECELDLFQISDKMDGTSRLVRRINNLIELHYIEPKNGAFRFTNAGINYMERKFNEHSKDIAGKDIDFGSMTGLLAKMDEHKGPKRNFALAFERKNLLIGWDEEVNYNKAQFSKVKDANEPMG